MQPQPSKVRCSGRDGAENEPVTYAPVGSVLFVRAPLIVYDRDGKSRPSIVSVAAGLSL